MRKLLILVAAAALLLVMLPVAPVGATPPSGVQIEVTTTLPAEGPSFGPFTATGPAVDAGLMCSSGDTVDVFGKAAGFQSERGFNLQVLKLFTCDDEPFGEFLVKLQVRIDAKGVSFSWNAFGGTGAYENLHGAGTGVGLPTCGEDCVFDVYDGKVHID